ncbi:MAG: outer membrane beta-barrel protein [Balneolaceae bacterium]|nr:outer membrane beta-barrel protein [Balneolaceae bacterium]
MRSRLLFACLLFIVLFLGHSKNAHSQELQVALDFDLAAPQGEFSDQLDKLGWGLNIMGGYRFGNTPFMLGLEFGFMNFGRDVRDAPLSTTIPDLRVEVENSYNLVHGDILLRLIPPPTTVRPYVEGLVGFNYFYTETVIRDRGSFSGEERLRDTNFEDTALSYGFGAGVQFRLYQDRSTVREPDEIAPSGVYLTLASRYMFGREAEYLQEGSIDVVSRPGEVLYDVSRSETNLLYFKLGVVISF